MNATRKYTAIAAIVVAVSAFGAIPAGAADSTGNPPAHPVSYKDLDMTRPAGAETLYQRIKSAADTVCAPLNGKQVIEKVSRNACVTSAVERAIKQVNEPMLTHYYLSLNPKSDLGTVLAVKR